MAGGTLRVLYIEDSKTDAMMVEAMLAHSDVADFSVVGAGSLADGLGAAADGPYDVIVCDLTLPDSEGLATFGAVRDSAPGVPVVVVTADGDVGLGRQALAAGAADFLVKGNMDGERLAQLLLFAVERQRHSPTGGMADPLTRLPNRNLFIDRLAQALLRAATDPRPVAVAAIGLFADSESDLRPDTLATAGEALLGALRPTDTLARIGPAEFAAIVEGIVRPANVERAVHRMLGAMAGGRVAPSVRCGVGLALGRTGDDAERVLGQAQGALRQIKIGPGAGFAWAR